MPYIDFTRPQALILLLLLIPVFYWYKNSIVDMPPLRRKVSMGIRMIIILAVILAISGLQLKHKIQDQSVLFLVDSSLSVTEQKKIWALDFIKKSMENKPPRDKAGVILFGRDALVEETLSPRLKITRFSSIIEPEHTDISRALQLASAVFPENTVKRVVLLTDGNQNLGNAEKQAELLASRGIEVRTVAYPTQKFSELMINRLEAPPEITRETPFLIKVEVESSLKTTGILNVYRNNTLLAREKVELQQGKNLFTIKDTLQAQGNYKYHAILESSSDSYSQNNTGETLVTVQGKPQILYIAGSSHREQLLGRIFKENNFNIKLGDVEDLPLTLAEMSQYRALVFDNLDGLLLSNSQLQMVENFVKDLGGGFIMIGGDASFGPGGYYRTPVENILPVDLDIRKRKNLPTAALILCIDKSGSMSEAADGVEKIALAREAAIATLHLLGNNDKIGVIGFDSASKWVTMLTYSDKKKEIANEIASLRAGGGTNIYPALDSAYLALKDSQAIVKHIILLSDGRSAPGNYKALTQKMQNENITLSTVGIGADADMPFLKELAQLGKGRVYYSENAKNLPRIFIRETFLAGKMAIVEKSFQPLYKTPAEFLEGLDQANLPQLLGYTVTTAKPIATTSHFANEEDPLLAYWRTGLGKSVAFTSDDGLKWGKTWLKWKDYEKFWVQALRWVIPDNLNDRYSVVTSLEQNRGKIVMEALDENGNPVNFLNLKARVVSPSGRTNEIEISQESVGRYKGTFSASEVGTYLINLVEERNGELITSKFQSFSVPFSPEYKQLDNNLYLLQKVANITNGEMIQNPEKVFEKNQKVVFYPQSIWPGLLLLALFLLPLDVASRRVYLPENFWDRFRIKRKEVLIEPETVITRVSKLKNIKQGLREKYQAPDTSETINVLKIKRKEETRPRQINVNIEKTQLKPGEISKKGQRKKEETTLGNLKKITRNFRNKHDQKKN
ncbi:MAG: VWA domain-containing protein [Vulcanimicrobiota bacterium]